ncbi:hypothetical protein [Nocardioides sp.]|uniref:hypothetical protein n=1 Tax=Nocardioides sp. TaxID=35761 RepID=UPI00262AE02A|nr:hypothetical protein [Nocardioides sp.]
MSHWFGVRSVYRFAERLDGRDVYEERVVIFKAPDLDDAIAQAETEAAEYVDLLGDGEAVGFYQAFAMSDEPSQGAEVFSLMRTSDLSVADYLDQHFDSGEERQQSAT